MTNYSKVRFYTLLEQPGDEGAERKWVANTLAAWEKKINSSKLLYLVTFFNFVEYENHQGKDIK